MRYSALSTYLSPEPLGSLQETFVCKNPMEFNKEGEALEWTSPCWRSQPPDKGGLSLYMLKPLQGFALTDNRLRTAYTPFYTEKELRYVRDDREQRLRAGGARMHPEHGCT